VRLSGASLHDVVSFFLYKLPAQKFRVIQAFEARKWGRRLSPPAGYKVD